MKSIFLLIVAMSLMLVGAAIVVAIPNANHAEATFCGPISPCTKGKGQCEKIPGNEGLCTKLKVA